jgi:hypothetical protein
VAHKGEVTGGEGSGGGEAVESMVRFRVGRERRKR